MGTCSLAAASQASIAMASEEPVWTAESGNCRQPTRASTALAEIRLALRESGVPERDEGGGMREGEGGGTREGEGGGGRGREEGRGRGRGEGRGRGRGEGWNEGGV